MEWDCSPDSIVTRAPGMIKKVQCRKSTNLRALVDSPNDVSMDSCPLDGGFVTTSSSASEPGNVVHDNS